MTSRFHDAAWPVITLNESQASSWTMMSRLWSENPIMAYQLVASNLTLIACEDQQLLRFVKLNK
jgi:hypothetical protein